MFKIFITSLLPKLDQTITSWEHFIKPKTKRRFIGTQEKKKASLITSSRPAYPGLLTAKSYRNIYHWITRSVSPSLGGK